MDFSFPFSNCSLPQPNVMKLIHNANTPKHISSLNFGGVTFTVLELCPFTNGKVAELFVSVLKLDIRRCGMSTNETTLHSSKNL